MMASSVLVVGFGAYSPKSLSAFKECKHIICVDGGVGYTRSSGLIPSYCIGDFDSARSEDIEWAASVGAKIERHPTHKDASDLELALKTALTLETKTIILSCISGRRPDHFLSNLSLLFNPIFKDISLKIVEDDFVALPLINGTYEISGSPGETFSLLPMSNTLESVTISGATWPLSNTEIKFGNSRTLSNTFKETKVSITLTDGRAILFHFSNQSSSYRCAK